MPLYEYYCPDCETKFDALRSFSQADDPIDCTHCQGTGAKRVISLFAAVSKGSDGERQRISGGGACSTCAVPTSCSTCSVR
ncbi:MAG: zinc ribbon domain-containing protein [Anaerolineae bacterium]